MKGREQLQAVVEPLPAELPDDHTGLESMYETDEPPVFDQDDLVTSGSDRSRRIARRPSGARGRLLSWLTGPYGTDDPSSPGVFAPPVPVLAGRTHERTPHRRRRSPAPTLARAVPCTSRPPLADLGTPVARIVEPVRLDLVLERVPDGIVARGELHARWEGECSTCLRELAADLVGRRRRAVRDRTRSTARPTRSRATRSTSSSSCATHWCSSCPLAPACARRLRPGQRPGVLDRRRRRRRPRQPCPIRGGPRSPISTSDHRL